MIGARAEPPAPVKPPARAADVVRGRFMRGRFMKFRVTYISGTTGQRADAVVDAVHPNAAGWAFIERGDTLISVAPANPAPRAAPVFMPPEPPAPRSNVFFFVAVLAVIG